MVHGEVDGERLTRAEIARFFILLVVAGNETTRNAITHGVRYLTEFPDQREVWLADIDGVTKTAVEEIVRYSSPVIYMRRTLTAPAVLADQQARGGRQGRSLLPVRQPRRRQDPQSRRVRRPALPERPHRLRRPRPALLPRRSPRPSRDLVDVPRAPRTRIPDIHTTAPPDLLLSDFVFGVKRQPCAYTARCDPRSALEQPDR